jgi:UDP-N-acetylmuramate-alanine ligase
MYCHHPEEMLFALQIAKKKLYQEEILHIYAP